MPSPADVRAAAAAFAAAAGVEIRLVEDAAGANTWAALCDSIWQMPPGASIVEPGHLVAMAHVGNYVATAFAGGEPVGVCYGFWHEPGDQALHSHIAGVRWDRLGSGIGKAMKYHQAAWLLDHGTEAMTWTFDPLIARNAAFNLRTLGVRVLEYLPDFYGAMNDGLNDGLPTDRLFVRWDFLEDGVPTPEGETSAVPIPGDIEAIRRRDPAAAAALALELRGKLLPLLAQGWQVCGFDRARSSYLLARP
ncbi:MAG: GNAT family N-acetyltransferase [Propionibacteriaceae bacterium]|nr:GNAT family N-acetyltransferase [Propionibacteriaceae bacterium]